MTTLRFKTFVVLVMLATAAHAAEHHAPQQVAASAATPHALAPAQLNAIRAVGRGVLAAKKSGTEDATDAEQVARLRASLDRLIAADLDPRNRSPITVQGHESGEQRRARQAVVELRAAARADARALAARLHTHGQRQAARARTASEDTRSAGMRIGAQRARLFERWADQLDTALADGATDRLGRLRVLREQLRQTQGGLSDAPLTHGTPTLQAMPAGFVPSDHTTHANDE